MQKASEDVNAGMDSGYPKTSDPALCSVDDAKFDSVVATRKGGM